jgi:alkanesulfonate monooxygenase SsuD/methylene tetrahydromethanopterin reductase-like flavin-dependent oxidoreductase (luciferase family)
VDFGIAIQNNREGASAEGMDASAEVANRFGWTSVWVADHLIIGRTGEGAGGPWFLQHNIDEHEWILEAILALTYVGARHERVRLGLGVLVPPMRDAPQLAKELATLDTLSGGRLVVGVGVGDIEDRSEYENLGKGDRLHVRGRYLDEAIALFRHLWSGRTDPFVGQFHQLRDFTFRPLPPRAAGIPILTGGRSNRALARVGVTTDGYYGARWSPDQFRAVWPSIVERAAANRRPRPHLAMRVRMRIEEEPDEILSLCGRPEAMVAGLLEYEEAGADEVIFVLDPVDAVAIATYAERVQRDIVEPYWEAWAARRRDRVPD